MGVARPAPATSTTARLRPGLSLHLVPVGSSRPGGTSAGTGPVFPVAEVKISMAVYEQWLRDHLAGGTVR